MEMHQNTAHCIAAGSEDALIGSRLSSHLLRHCFLVKVDS